MGYGGEKLKVMGRCHAKCSYKGSEKVLQLCMIETQAPAVLGLRTSKEIELVKIIMTVDGGHRGLTEADIKCEYCDLFKGLRCLPGVSRIRIKEGAQPVIHAPRRIPFNSCE